MDENTKAIKKNTDEITIRILQNGRYVWTITTGRDSSEFLTAVEHLKQVDGALRDAFPNHVKESSVQFKEFKDE